MLHFVIVFLRCFTSNAPGYVRSVQRSLKNSTDQKDPVQSGQNKVDYLVVRVHLEGLHVRKRTESWDDDTTRRIALVDGEDVANGEPAANRGLAVTAKCAAVSQREPVKHRLAVCEMTCSFFPGRQEQPRRSPKLLRRHSQTIPDRMMVVADL